MNIDKVYITHSLWQQFCAARTHHEYRRVAGQRVGSLTWASADPAHWAHTTDEEQYRLRYLMAICDYRLAHGYTEDEINERGNTIIRSHRNNGDRYKFDWDECSSSKGWQQYDTSQDAWYFGVWVHPGERRVLTYAEGDVTLVECPTRESFAAKLKSMEEFYGPAPPAMIACNDIGYADRKIVPKDVVGVWVAPRLTAEEV